MKRGIGFVETCRRAIQKRVVQIPIKETEGCRLKGESNTPPSDSWAWRKYGQKPIKGSPYPRLIPFRKRFSLVIHVWLLLCTK